MFKLIPIIAVLAVIHASAEKAVPAAAVYVPQDKFVVGFVPMPDVSSHSNLQPAQVILAR